ARVTTSRGARSPRGGTPAITGVPSPSRRTAPSPRLASEMSGRGGSGGPPGWSPGGSGRSPATCRAVGWNWTNSRSARPAPARRAAATPAPGARGGGGATAQPRPGQAPPGPQGGGAPVAGGQGRVGGVGEQLPGPAAGQHD